MNEPQFKDWDLSHWQYRYGKPKASAKFKTYPEDFIVTEKLGFELTGEGENLFLLIEKTQLNTQQVCEHLAKFFSRRLRDIGYAGLKDKQSISRQWFSVQMNITQTVDLTGLETEQIKLISSTRHQKKLKVGALKSNHFDILLRDVSDFDDLQQRLVLIKQGVPNYFGLQRFGFKGNNLNWSNRMASGEAIRDKKIRGFALSAARSYMFNQVVSDRISQGCFDKVSVGDKLILSGSNSFFIVDEINETLQERISEHDVCLSAPLFGKNKKVTDEQQGSTSDSASHTETQQIENSVAENHQSWLNLLIDNGLELEFRAINLIASNIDWRKSGTDARISFELPSGTFATSVLRECVTFE